MTTSRASAQARPASSRLAPVLRSLVTAAVSVGVVALMLPPQFGGRITFTIVSGHSMDPTYHTYDLAVTLRSGEPKVGDVIVYRVPEGEPGAGGQVIHRVVGGDPRTGYVTQGDNREGPDVWRPTNKDVVGRVVGIVPQAGRLIVTILNLKNLGLVALGLFTWALWPRRAERAPTKAARRLEILMNLERVAA